MPMSVAVLGLNVVVEVIEFAVFLEPNWRKPTYVREANPDH